MSLTELIEILKIATEIDLVDKRREEIQKIMPEIAIMFDFDQQNKYHQFDLWKHCLHTALNLPRGLEDEMLYLAALLHDIGKPAMQQSGPSFGDTDMHYRGHPMKSLEIVRDTILPQLEQNGYVLSEDEKRRLLYYVEHHDDRIAIQESHLKRHLELVPFEEFQKLMLLQVADATAHVQLPLITNRLEVCMALAGEEGERLYREISQEE